VDAGDYVVVSNALHVRLTGKKGEDKKYYHHTGFMGGLKEVPISRVRERRPEEVSISHSLARLGHPTTEPPRLQERHPLFFFDRRGPGDCLRSAG